MTDHQPPYPGQTPPPFPGQTPPPFAGQGAPGAQAGGQAPGWYPDPTQAGNQREWDGQQWVGPSVPMSGGPGGPGAKKGGFPKWLIPVIACVALGFIAVVGGAIAGSGDDDKDKEEVSAEESTTTEAEEEETTTTEEETTTTEEETTTTTEAPTTTTTEAAPSLEEQARAWNDENAFIFTTLSGDLDNIATASQAQDVAALNVACTGLQTNVGIALGLDPIPLPETERLWRDALGEFQSAADLCIQGTAAGLDPQKIVDAAGHISAGTDLLNQAAATIPGN